jgi:hypothetical protein
MKGKTLEDLLNECKAEVEQFLDKDMTRGFYRKPVTANEQINMFKKDKLLYVLDENLLFWAEKSLQGYEIDYDNPQAIINYCDVIPLAICGVDGNEFEKETRVVYTKETSVKVINGEEQDILQGRKRGDGSEILFS